MLGGFSEEALQLFQLAASEQSYEFSEEGETYDFTRCMRADGTFYGTSGRCKSGSDAGAKEIAKPKGRSKTNTAAPGNATTAKKPRATTKDLGAAQRKLYDAAKALRKKEKETLAEWKRVSTANKRDKSPAAKKAILEAGKAADKAANAARRAENAWSKAHERWSKSGERDNRKKMSPSQRAEARRVDKIIKERG